MLKVDFSDSEVQNLGAKLKIGLENRYREKLNAIRSLVQSLVGKKLNHIFYKSKKWEPISEYVVVC